MQMAKLAEWIVAGVIAAAPVAQAQQSGGCGRSARDIAAAGAQ